MKHILSGLAAALLMVSSSEDKEKNPEVRKQAVKLCALTFDDGPSADPELTSLVLDKLEKYDIPATFFWVGRNINSATHSVIDRVVRNGHEIGNHSWSQDDMASMDAAEVKKSVQDTSAAIEKYTGIRPVFFRAPNLSVSQTMYDVINMPFAGGVLGYDWSGGESTSPEQIAERVKEGVRDGAIILLHDVQPKPHHTPEALDLLIPQLKMEGYEFVTLSELFKRKKVQWDTEAESMYIYVQ